MSEPIELRRLTIMPTLKCTLKCKLCCNYMTMFENPKHVPVEEIIHDIDRVFKLVDYTEWLQLVGGEIFMRRDLWKIFDHCLKYKDKFQKLILITNATLLPSKEDLEVLKKYKDGVQVQISDYGKHSYAANEMAEIFEKEGIPFVIKRYHGDIQHYSGWVDNTHFHDRGKNDEDLKEQFENCGQVIMKNFHMYNGKLHGCARSLMATTLGKIEPASRDYIDLNDNKMSNEEKREIIRHFNDSPRVSCRSCISFSEDAERFAAAEQIN